MKYKVTFKALKATAKDHTNCVYSCPYCALQHTLSGIEPIAYHAGIYGWDCDIYLINDYLIVTGYKCPTADPNIISIGKKDCELLEQLAKKSSSFTARITLQNMLDEYKKMHS